MTNKSPEVTVSFPLNGTENVRWNQNADSFPDNAHVTGFTHEEEEELFRNLSELRLQGQRGILHVIFGGTLTGLSVQDSIPAIVRESQAYEQLHVLSPEQFRNLHPQYRQYLDNNPRHLVIIEEDGSMNEEFKLYLTRALKSRTGIILGGGPGHVKDKRYQPLYHYLEEPFKTGTPIAGICLGAQMVGHMLHSNGFGNGVHDGYYELGPQIEHITPDGLNHPVFQRLSPSVTVVHVNEYHWDPGALTDVVQVLSKNAAGFPSALSIRLSTVHQALVWQAHPEFPMKGNGRKQSFHLDDRQIRIPDSSSDIYNNFIQRFVTGDRQYTDLSSRYGLTADDVDDLLNPSRIVLHLGQRFYGPLLQYMASLQMSS